MTQVPRRSRADVDPVVITGIGAVSPLGSSFAEISESLFAGRSGVREIDGGEYAREGRQFACPVNEIPPPPAGSC